MTSKFLSLIAGAAALGLVGAAANAAEPLTDAQMDSVTAGTYTYKNAQFYKVAVITYNRLDGNTAKAEADATVVAPSWKDSFTYTETGALVDAKTIPWHTITASYSKSVAVLD
jgi:Tfp pilus assembly protein PilX